MTVLDYQRERIKICVLGDFVSILDYYIKLFWWQKFLFVEKWNNPSENWGSLHLNDPGQIHCREGD